MCERKPSERKSWFCCMDINYQASPTAVAFHADNSLFKGLRGPVGGGKTVACCMDILKHAWTQRAFKGVRRTKVALIRSTYPELKSTTIATWLDWFGDYTSMTYGAPIQGIFTPPSLDDETRVRCELIFLALDRPADIRKLKSLEVSMIFFNEASELHESHVHMAPARLRYPSKAMGGMTHGQIICDTNSPNIDNWYYKLDHNDNDFSYVDENNVTREVKYTFHTQPPAMFKTDSGYVSNPDAENVENLPDGHAYYIKQLPGKPSAWVDVFVCNQYGSSDPGNRVYPDYSTLNHTEQVLDEDLNICLACDFNFSPLSSAILQIDADNNVYAIDEIVLKGAVASETAFEYVERYQDYKNLTVSIYGDASGHVGQKHGKRSEYMIMEQVLRDAGFRVQMKVPRANPAIRDGQNSLRAKILDATGHRSLFVNPVKCPTLDTGLLTLQFKEGSTFIEQENDFQHITTAARYLTNKEWPIRKAYKAPAKFWK